MNNPEQLASKVVGALVSDVGGLPSQIQRRIHNELVTMFEAIPHSQLTEQQIEQLVMGDESGMVPFHLQLAYPTLSRYLEKVLT